MARKRAAIQTDTTVPTAPMRAGMTTSAIAVSSLTSSTQLMSSASLSSRMYRVTRDAFESSFVGEQCHTSSDSSSSTIFITSGFARDQHKNCCSRSGSPRVTWENPGA